MSEEKRFLDQAGLKQVFAIIKTNIAANYVKLEEGKGLSTNDLTDDLLLKLENLNRAGEPNVLEAVKVNGTALDISNKAVNITSADVVTATAISDALGFAPISETAIDGKVADAKEELQEAIDEAVADIAAINTLKYKVVDALPTVADAEAETIYLVPAVRTDVEEVANNVYVEYFVINGAWEEIGDTQLKLDDYAKSADVEEAIESVTDAIDETKTEILTEVETNYVKEVEFVDKVKETLETEEIVKIIENNIHVMTEAEIIALFEGAPVVMHADGSYAVVEDVAEAIVAAQAGDVVVLVEDVTIAENIEIQDGVEIDLNGHTLTLA